MKQTAVEYLVEQLRLSHKEAYNDLYEVIEQAKEIEKQQIVDAYGNQTKKYGGISNHNYILTGKQYYNETFNKKTI